MLKNQQLQHTLVLGLLIIMMMPIFLIFPSPFPSLSPFHLVFAQEAPPIQTEKGLLKMDSILAQLYTKYSNSEEDANDFANTHGLYIRDGNVRVAIELVDNNAKLPQDLGIVEEARSGNQVQALVPIKSLQQLSLSDSVRFISIPLEAVPLESSNNEGFLSIDRLLVIAISVVSLSLAIGLVYYWKKRRHV